MTDALADVAYRTAKRAQGRTDDPDSLPGTLRRVRLAQADRWAANRWAAVGNIVTLRHTNGAVMRCRASEASVDGWP